MKLVKRYSEFVLERNEVNTNQFDSLVQLTYGDGKITNNAFMLEDDGSSVFPMTIKDRENYIIDSFNVERINTMIGDIKMLDLITVEDVNSYEGKMSSVGDNKYIVDIIVPRYGLTKEKYIELVTENPNITVKELTEIYKDIEVSFKLFCNLKGFDLVEEQSYSFENFEMTQISVELNRVILSEDSEIYQATLEEIKKLNITYKSGYVEDILNRN